jgi:hypothetical protein
MLTYADRFDVADPRVRLTHAGVSVETQTQTHAHTKNNSGGGVVFDEVRESLNRALIEP